MLRLGLGRGAADELLLASQRVLPGKLSGVGYVHAFPDISGALAAALSPHGPGGQPGPTGQSRLAP